MAQLLSLLKQDHQRARAQLMKCMENANQVEKASLNQLELDLRIHMDMEETLMYPRFRKIPELTARTEEMLNEHKRIKTLLLKFSGKEVKEVYGLDEILQSLLDEVDHHVEEEENDILPAYLRIVPIKEADRLADEMQQFKLEQQVKAKTKIP